jgi:two-component system phosphate regulon sensor histidine kinase PhoR
MNRQLSVKVKYPAIFLLATAIPITVLAFFAYRTTHDILRTEIFTAGRVASSHLAKFIQAHVDSARRAVAEVSVRPGLRAAVERRDYEFVNRVFRGLTAADSEFSGFVLLSPTGVVLAAESRYPALVAGVVGSDRSERDYFRHALEEKETYVSDVLIPASGNPAVVIAAPILGPGGEVLAVVGGGLSLTRIQSLMRDAAESVSATGILVDKHGMLIAHPKSELVGRRQSFAGLPQIQEALAGRSGTREIWNASDREHQLVSYQPISGLGWAVLIASPVAQVYAPIARLHGTLLAIAGLVLVAALLVSVAIGFGIARPLDHLANATRRFGEGDRSARAAIARRDEIGEVARAFNGMASRVSALEEERIKYAERLKLLHEIDQAIITAAEPVAIAEAVLPRLRDLLGVPRAIVNLFDLEAGEAEWLAAVGRRRISLGPVRFPLTLMGDLEALRRGELQVIDTTALPPIPAAEALLASGVLTYMVVPMIAEGELIGAVSFGGAAGEFPLEQVGIAQEVAAQLAIALAQARLHKRVKRQAEELEAAVEDRTRDLDRQRTHLEAVLAGMGEGVCVIDTDGRVLLWNLAAERIKGVPASAMVGTIFPGPLSIVHGDLVVSDFSQTLMKRALDTGERVSTTSSRVTRPDGTEIGIAMTAAPVRDASGAIFGCVNVFRDVTREREVDRMKSEFVSTVSHELRTPLTSIRAYAETLRDMVEDNPTVQEFLTVIEEEAVRLTRLINNLLNVSRIESGRVQLGDDPAVLEPLVRRAIETVQPKATTSEVAIEVEIPPNLPPFRGDVDAIQQVLTNLVDNAVKYNRRGGRVQVRAWLNGGVEVEVRDTGMGLSEEAVRRLGERFFRVDSSETRLIGGTGLGMTLVKEILAGHGVQLEVESVEGKGSVFRFVLPLAERRHEAGARGR